MTYYLSLNDDEFDLIVEFLQGAPKNKKMRKAGLELRERLLGEKSSLLSFLDKEQDNEYQTLLVDDEVSDYLPLDGGGLVERPRDSGFEDW